jgi:ferredoxin
MGALEAALVRRDGLRADERVACLAVVEGDVTITTGYW